MEEINKKDLLKLIKDVEKANNNLKAKIISPEKYRDSLGEKFHNRRVEYSNEDGEFILDLNKLYIIKDKK